MELYNKAIELEPRSSIAHHNRLRLIESINQIMDAMYDKAMRKTDAEYAGEELQAHLKEGGVLN